MHGHSHECGVCSHDCLHYCTCCGKVYCCKCKQEWGGYSYYWPWYTETVPNILCGTTTIVSDSTSVYMGTVSHLHSH